MAKSFKKNTKEQLLICLRNTMQIESVEPQSSFDYIANLTHYTDVQFREFIVILCLELNQLWQGKT